MYYKLVELTGMISVISGINFSMTQTADLIVTAYHNQYYHEFLKKINNPQELQKIRTEVQQGLSTALEIFKNVKITE